MQDVDPSLKEYRVVPILDPFGPSVEDPSLNLIVGSQETEKGCQKVNEERKTRGLSQLDIHVIGRLTYNKLTLKNRHKVDCTHACSAFNKLSIKLNSFDRYN